MRSFRRPIAKPAKRKILSIASLVPNSKWTQRGGTILRIIPYRSDPSFAVATCRTSHLSPDGGSLPRTPTTAWQRMATIRPIPRSHLSPGPPVPVATCRQTVEALLAPPPPLGSGWLRFGPVARRWIRLDQANPRQRLRTNCPTGCEGKHRVAWISSGP